MGHCLRYALFYLDDIRLEVSEELQFAAKVKASSSMQYSIPLGHLNVFCIQISPTVTEGKTFCIHSVILIGVIKRHVLPKGISITLEFVLKRH